MPDETGGGAATAADRKGRRKLAQAVEDYLEKLGTAAARELLPETVYSYDGRRWWRREPELGVAVELPPALLVADLEQVADREWSGRYREVAARHQPLEAALERLGGLGGLGGVTRVTLMPYMLAAYKDLELPLWRSIRAERRRNKRALDGDTLCLATGVASGKSVGG